MNRADEQTAITVFSAWAAGRSFGGAPVARQRAVSAFIDTIGCLIAGLEEAASFRARKAMLSFKSVGATAFPNTPATPATAALLNATAAHALDFDDHENVGVTHPSAVLVPALMAVGEAERCRGGALVDAYIVGYELTAYVGARTNPDHYAAGWHATGTIGAIAAAAACARLLDMDKDQIGNAISLACSMASGIQSQFGTMAKPLQAGLAAQAGVTSAYLAAAGMTGSIDALDGPTGLIALMTRSHPQKDGIEPPGEDILAIERHGPIVKRFPACAATHRTLDGVLDLVEMHDLTPSDILRVETELPETAANALKYPDPKDEMQARFSMPYCVSVAIETGSLSLRDFRPVAIDRSAIRDRMRCIFLSSHASVGNPFSSGAYRVRTALTLRNGRIFEDVRFHARGAPENPLDDEALRTKFKDCVSLGYLLTDPDRMFARLQDLDAIGDIPEFIASISTVLRLRPQEADLARNSRDSSVAAG